MKNTKMKHAFLMLLVAVALVGSFCFPSRTRGQERTDLFLNVVPFGYYVDMRAGEEKTLYLEIRNVGTTSVTNVSLSSEHPDGWSLEFDPADVAIIGPNGLQTVNVILTLPANASTGEHHINLVASATEIRRVQSITVDVRPASYWVWVGVGVLAVIVAVFAVVFVRMGRGRSLG